jgi:hypothetical protein
VCESTLTEPLYVKDGKVNNDGTLPKVFLYLTGGAEKCSCATPTTTVILDQKGCLFQPHVLGIVVRQELWRGRRTLRTAKQIKPMRAV